MRRIVVKLLEVTVIAGTMGKLQPLPPAPDSYASEAPNDDRSYVQISEVARAGETFDIDDEICKNGRFVFGVRLVTRQGVISRSGRCW